MPRHTKVVLYGLPHSVYTRIARLALEEKGVPYAFEEVDVFDREGPPREYLSLHPFGRIPALEHNGVSLYETSAICRYIDEAFPGISLQSGDAAVRARISQVVAILDSYAYRPMVWDVFVQQVDRPGSSLPSHASTVKRGIEESRRCLRALSSIQDGNPFLAGDQLSLADLHAYPMLLYLTLAPEGKVLMSEFAALSKWLSQLAMRPSVVRTRGVHEIKDLRG
jgi:glutathione S-transferase